MRRRSHQLLHCECSPAFKWLLIISLSINSALFYILIARLYKADVKAIVDIPRHSVEPKQIEPPTTYRGYNISLLSADIRSMFLEGTVDCTDSPNPAIPRFAVVTLIDKHYEILRNTIVENRRRYAAKHGYAFCIAGHDLVGEERRSHWGKLLAVLKLLPDYDWVFWMDADSLIVNMNIKLSKLADKRYNFIIAGKDEGINTGTFLVRRSEWSFEFLQEVFVNTNHSFGQRGWNDQGAIIDLLRRKPQHEYYVKHVSGLLMNSFPENFTPGQFVIHTPGCFCCNPPEQCAERLRAYLKYLVE